jgi:tetratricopeptide repeat protein 30
VKHYRLSYIESLYKAGKLEEADRQCFAARQAIGDDDPTFTSQLYLLHSTIKYDKEELAGAQDLLTRYCNTDDQDVKITEAAILFKQKRYDKACEKLIETIAAGGYQPHVAYNIALCHFMTKQYVMSLKSIEDITDKAIQDYQGLSVHSQCSFRL